MTGRVLMTGATGFLGGAVCRLLTRRGWQVTATGRNETLGQLLAQQGFPFRRASLEIPAGTMGICDGQDAVVHRAALSSPWGTRRKFQAANVTATANALRAATFARVKRFVRVSTPSVYFDFRHRLGLTEDSPLAARPANAYAFTQLAAERLVLAASADGLPAIILHPRATFGPGDTAILPRLLRAASKGRRPVIDNAAEAVACALDIPAGCDGQAFNITDGAPVVLWEFIAALFAQMDSPPPRCRILLHVALALATGSKFFGRIIGREPATTRNTVGNVGYSQTFDISKARALLGYRPVVSTAEGAGRLVESLRRSRLPDA